jgi:hypothetical protein
MNYTVFISISLFVIALIFYVSQYLIVKAKEAENLASEKEDGNSFEQKIIAKLFSDGE